MNIIAQLNGVSSTLRELFKEDGQLHGINDWDRLIGCIMLLDRIVNNLRATEKATMVEEDKRGG